MREVILQNMMGRSVLPFPLSLQTKNTQDSVQTKIKPPLFSFVVIVLIVFEVFGYNKYICSQKIFLFKEY